MNKADKLEKKRFKMFIRNLKRWRIIQAKKKK